LKENLLIALRAALAAGKEILEVYSQPVAVELKEDRSPLTEADKRAHACIVQYLSVTGFPVLSEEGRSIPFSERKNWKEFWLVDPLDGTKEFIKRNGEFTVNIAFIVDQQPAMGIVYAPVTGMLYFNVPGSGSYRKQNFSETKEDLNAFLSECEKLPAVKSESYTVVASRSHMSNETAAFIDELKKSHGDVTLISKGSSLKICLVAEGSAHVYPRFAPTMEWDTAAGHAVILGMGKQVVNPNTNLPLSYNKEDLLNPWFIAG
jgi:3'(2'), 5'-bisphosphate nucleotidase